MVVTRSQTQSCVYCLDTVLTYPVELCAQCSAVSCAQCFEVALKKQMLTPETMAKNITCPMCRTPMLPSFAQVLKSSRLQESIRWYNDSSNYRRFWRMTGRHVLPQLGISRFIMCMYALSAELRMQLLHCATIDIERVDTLSKLRPKTNRSNEIAAITQAASLVTRRFEECEPWNLPLR